MKLILALIPVLVCSLPADEKNDPIVVTKDTVSTFYRGFPRLTKEPHPVSEPMTDLCGPAPPALMKAHAGPHFDKKLHIYVNSAAKRTIAKRGAVFPVGAVIIKEKLSADGAISGIGGMIKRDPGFNLGHGDWEYFYDDKVSGYKTGKLENCSICHTRARGTDFVFSVWDMLKPG